MTRHSRCHPSSAILSRRSPARWGAPVTHPSPRDRLLPSGALRNHVPSRRSRHTRNALQRRLRMQGRFLVREDGGRRHVRQALPAQSVWLVHRRASLPRGRRLWIGVGRVRVIVRGLLRHAARVSVLFFVGCGSRTQFEFIDGPPECTEDKDCDGYGDLCFPVGCVKNTCQDLAPVSCDDHNPCTADTCDPTNGTCLHPSSTLDLDNDGHRAPLPGKAPGEIDSCGDDCDDTNAMAFPGGVEVCDGLDNDCNGVVDDGAQFSPVGDAVKVSDGTIGNPQSLGYSGAAATWVCTRPRSTAGLRSTSIP